MKKSVEIIGEIREIATVADGDVAVKSTEATSAKNVRKPGVAGG